MARVRFAVPPLNLLSWLKLNSRSISVCSPPACLPAFNFNSLMCLCYLCVCVLTSDISYTPTICLQFLLYNCISISTIFFQLAPIFSSNTKSWLSLWLINTCPILYYTILFIVLVNFFLKVESQPRISFVRSLCPFALLLSFLISCCPTISNCFFFFLPNLPAKFDFPTFLPQDQRSSSSTSTRLSSQYSKMNVVHNF